MRHRALIAALLGTVALGCIQAAESPSRLPAFPGAEGAGKWSKGGRGGKVILVTNLNDSGPGSLRAALEAREPRTVIFRVSGTIELSKPLRILHPYITIAGQTAPGDGICLKGQELQIGKTHDVIVRHLRCRLGDRTSKAGERDAISVWDVRDVIIDHCSATWSTDECLSITNDSDRVTVQHCIIAEALTEHSYGSIIGAHDGAISFLHNLYANNRSRNPRPGGYQTDPARKGDPGPRIDFRNNVIFNWGSGAGYTGAGDAAQPERIAINYVGNYIKPGADTSPAYRGRLFSIYKGAVAEMYLEGNQVEDPPQRISAQMDLLMVNPGSTLVLRDQPLPIEDLPPALKASAAYAQVLESVGAIKPRRDAVDTRIVSGVRDGSGRRLMTIAEDAWPPLQSTPAPEDQDGDGLPDAWERQHGLNEKDPADANRSTGPQCWTHLEVWMNGL